MHIKVKPHAQFQDFKNYDVLYLRVMEDTLEDTLADLGVETEDLKTCREIRRVL